MLCLKGPIGQIRMAQEWYNGKAPGTVSTYLAIDLIFFILSLYFFNEV
jgi:hypothetical protein